MTETFKAIPQGMGTGSETGNGSADLNEQREIKVKLPVSLHIKLHGLKITKHKPISEVVLEALEDYFHRLEGNGTRRP